MEEKKDAVLGMIADLYNENKALKETISYFKSVLREIATTEYVPDDAAKLKSIYIMHGLEHLCKGGE